MNTLCPPVTSLRKTLETHILGLYLADGVTLRPESDWPGYYQLSNGTRIPAVYVVGTSMVPSNWDVVGIECTIEDVPESRSRPSMSGVLTTEVWTARFTNYGTKEGTSMPVNLLDISRRLARTFPSDQVTYMPRTEETFEAITARIHGAVLNPPIP